MATTLTIGFGAPALVLQHTGSERVRDAAPRVPTATETILADVRQHVATELAKPTPTADRAAGSTGPTTVADRSVTKARADRRASQLPTPSQTRSIAKLPCVDAERDVAGIGRACRVKGGLLKIGTGDTASLSHGGDPTPAAMASRAVASSLFGLAGETADARTDARVIQSAALANYAAPATLPSGTVNDINCAEPGDIAHRLVYAVPSDKPDRTAAVTAQLRAYVYDASAFLDAQARAIDPARHMRLKIRCDANGVPEIDTFRLTIPSAGLTYAGIRLQIRNSDMPRFAGPRTATLIFVDGGIDDGATGGMADTNADTRATPDNYSASGNFFAQIYNNGPGWSAFTTLHEVSHNMGAVFGGPNATGEGHCNDGQDIMCYQVPGQIYDPAVCATVQFDCNKNDYFNPLPTPGSYLDTHWNIAGLYSGQIDIAGVNDTEAPTGAVITDPTTPGATVSSITVAASDNVRVSKVELNVGGTIVTDYLAPFVFNTASITHIPQGPNTIQATAFDSAGNSVTGAATTAFIDNEPPPLVGLSGGGTELNNGLNYLGETTDVKLFWETVEDVSGVDYFWCFSQAQDDCLAGGASYTSYGVVENPTKHVATVTVPTALLPGGVPLVEDNGATKYNLCVMTVDHLGNRGSKVSCSEQVLAVDTQAPSAPAAARDGNVTGSDAANLTQLGVNWDGATDVGYSGINFYETCYSTSAACTTGKILDWGYNLDYSRGPGIGYSPLTIPTTLPGLTDNTVYYVCVRAVDGARHRGPQVCSNGQRLDLNAPTAPLTAFDGLDTDKVWLTAPTIPTTTVSGTWSLGSDSSSGVAGYRWCVTETPGATTAACTGGYIQAGLGTDGIVIGASSVQATRVAGVLQGHTYYVCALTVDVVGRQSPMTCSDGARVDSEAPSPIGAVRDGATSDLLWQTQGTSLTSNWDATTDTISGIASIEYCMATATNCGGTQLKPWTSIGTSGTSVTANALALASGTTVFTCVRATDVAGNQNAVRCSNGVSVDVDMPVAAVATAPAQNEIVNDTTLLRWSPGTDATSGVLKQVLLIDGFELADGDMDAAQAARNAPSLADGSHTWQVATIDRAGQRTNSAVWSFNVSHAGPTAPVLLTPSNGAVLDTKLPTLTWTAATGNGSPIANHRLSFIGAGVTAQTLSATATSYQPTTPLADGYYTWTVYAYDGLVRPSAVPTSRTFLIDTVDPSPAQFSSTFSGWQQSGSVDLTWNGQNDGFGSFAGSGVAKLELAVDSGAAIQLGAASTRRHLDLADGTHTIRLTTFDVAGHSASRTTTVKVDSTAPTLALGAPADGATNVSIHPEFTWTGSDAGSGSNIDPNDYLYYTIVIDGGSPIGATSYTPSTFTLSQGGLTAGAHTWYMTALDTAGNLATSTTRTFTVAAPGGGGGGGNPGGGTATGTPYTSYPYSGAPLSDGGPQFAWFPAANATSYEVWVDGTLRHIANGGTTTWQFAPGVLADGAHTWHVVAVGAEGPATSNTSAFTIDSRVDTAPSITAPSAGTVFTTATPQVTWSAATDLGTGLSFYELRIDGQSATYTDGSTLAAVLQSPLANGAHTVDVVAHDLVGNSRASTAVSFTVQVVAPPQPQPPVDGGSGGTGGATPAPVPPAPTPVPPAPTPVKPTLPVNMTGGAKADTFIGNALANLINGGGGNDSLNGGAGNDTVRGGTGNDKVVGGTGKDKLFGDAGNDVLDGNDHAKGDVIDGGAGKDTCTYNKGDVVKNCEKKLLKK